MLAKITKIASIVFIAFAVILLSVLATVIAVNYMRGNPISVSDIFSMRAFQLNRQTEQGNYALFAGHTACEEAIREKASGKIISLTSDDRAARVNTYANTNILTFKASILDDNVEFRSEQASTREFDVRCSTSIATNKVVNVSITPVEQF